MKFTRMPCGSPLTDGHGVVDPETLTAFWPDWRHAGPLPPLDDWMVEMAVRNDQVPEWIIDRRETIHRFGGKAFERGTPLMGPTAVVKPRWNPNGLSEGVQILRQPQLPRTVQPREIGQPFYTGHHLSTDWAFIQGVPKWGIRAEGTPGPVPGQFHQWRVVRGLDIEWPHAKQIAGLEDFTGTVNVETIDQDIIEVHFRPSIEFFPLYGAAAVKEIMLTARGLHARPPRVGGGIAQVTPRAARVVHCQDDLGEFSWRRSIAYIPEAPE